MLRAVNANQDEFILRREGRNFAHIDFYASLPIEEIFQRKGQWMIAEGEFRVEFNKEFRARMMKSIFPGSLFRPDRCK